MKESLNQFLNTENASWQSLVLIYGAKVLLAAIFLIIGFWIINKIIKALSVFFDHRRIDSTLKGFLKTFIGVSLKILLLLIVLSFIGIQTTSVVALVGAAGLAIGLALQGTLANFAGGVMILLFRPFRVGDIIESQGKKGVVIDIQIFTTILQTEAKRIIIPNNLLSSGIIENHGKDKAS